MRLAPLLALSACLLASIPFAAHAADSALAKAVSGSQRHQQNVARDPFRHPAEELEFFGIKPAMTVVEVWPGGGYWTEILAPYLHDRGAYYVAVPPGTADRVKGKLDATTATYGNVKITEFGENRYD